MSWCGGKPSPPPLPLKIYLSFISSAGAPRIWRAMALRRASWPTRRNRSTSCALRAESGRRPRPSSLLIFVGSSPVRAQPKTTHLLKISASESSSDGSDAAGTLGRSAANSSAEKNPRSTTKPSDRYCETWASVRDAAIFSGERWFNSLKLEDPLPFETLPVI